MRSFILSQCRDIGLLVLLKLLLSKSTLSNNPNIAACIERSIDLIKSEIRTARLKIKLSQNIDKNIRFCCEY